MRGSSSSYVRQRGEGNFLKCRGLPRRSEPVFLTAVRGGLDVSVDFVFQTPRRKRVSACMRTLRQRLPRTRRRKSVRGASSSLGVLLRQRRRRAHERQRVADSSGPVQSLAGKRRGGCGKEGHLVTPNSTPGGLRLDARERTPRGAGGGSRSAAHGGGRYFSQRVKASHAASARGFARARRRALRGREAANAARNRKGALRPRLHACLGRRRGLAGNRRRAISGRASSRCGVKGDAAARGAS